MAHQSAASRLAGAVRKLAQQQISQTAELVRVDYPEVDADIAEACASVSASLIGDDASLAMVIAATTRDCGSPIERALLPALVLASCHSGALPHLFHGVTTHRASLPFYRLPDGGFCDDDLRHKDDPEASSPFDMLTITPQAAIGKYTADFLLTVAVLRPDDSRERVCVVVECDGHDYHERTKEQAAHDRSRDRSMLADGYHVLRFTGSEIWNGPLACAVEAIGLLSKKASEQSGHPVTRDELVALRRRMGVS